MLKILQRDLYLLKVDRFSFGNDNMAKIYEYSLSTIIPHGKNRDFLDPRSQTLSGEDTACMVNFLEIPRIVECLLTYLFIFFIFYYMIELL